MIEMDYYIAVDGDESRLFNHWTADTPEDVVDHVWRDRLMNDEDGAPLRSTLRRAEPHTLEVTHTWFDYETRINIRGDRNAVDEVYRKLYVGPYTEAD